MFDLSAVVACDAELEAVVGARPGAIMLKSIRFLDQHCERLLACSPYAVIGTTTGDGSLQTIALGGEPGLAAPRSGTVLELGDVSGKDVVDGAPAGLIALVPGYGETLRINGRLRVRDNIATLEVEQALLHCAKAIMRSGLWTAQGTPEPCGGAAVQAVAAFLADAPFVVLVSTDADGHADASPKGDPPGLIRQIDDTTIAIADRPGNRRTDTLHNLMDEPRIALLAMVPGSHYVAEIRGTARVCTDDALLESMRIRNRTPKVALLIDVEHNGTTRCGRRPFGRSRPLERQLDLLRDESNRRPTGRRVPPRQPIQPTACIPARRELPVPNPARRPPSYLGQTLSLTRRNGPPQQQRPVDQGGRPSNPSDWAEL